MFGLELLARSPLEFTFASAAITRLPLECWSPLVKVSLVQQFGVQHKESVVSSSLIEGNALGA